MPDGANFEAWCDSLEIDLGDTDDQEDRDRFLKGWLRRLYETEGPLAKDLVGVAFVLDQVALGANNAALVRRDIESTTEFRPNIVVDDYEGVVRISVDGSHTTPSVESWCNPQALAETADYMQAHVGEALWRVWPVCPRDGFGLYAQVREGVAVWWCRFGSHSIAALGQLGEMGASVDD